MHKQKLHYFVSIASLFHAALPEGHMKRVTVQVPDDLHRRLKYLAIEADTTMQKIFLDAVKLYIQESEKRDVSQNAF